MTTRTWTDGSGLPVNAGNLNGIESDLTSAQNTANTHAARHAVNGADPVSPSSIGAANATHQHAASDITSGVLAPGQLGTGVADSTKVLHGDGTWQALDFSNTYVQWGNVGSPSGVAGLDSNGMVPASQLPTSTADYGYFFLGFTNDGQPFEKMSLLSSHDGHSFLSSSLNPIYTDPNTGNSFRDPSIAKIGNYWFCAYTINNGSSKNFGIIKSTDLVNWTSLSGTANTPTLVDTSAATNISKCWAPELFVDPAGNVYAFWTNVDTSNNWAIWYTQFTDNTGLTTWNAPVKLTWAASPGTTVWDATVLYDSSAQLYRMFYAVNGGYIQRAYCSTVTGTWTTDKTGDWAGWIANNPDASLGGLEAPEITYSNGTYRIYFDPYINPSPYTHPGYQYSESSDLTTWSAPKNVSNGPGMPIGQVMRHGAFVHLTTQTGRNAVDDAMAARPPVRHGEYTGSFATTGGTKTGPGALTMDTGSSFKASDFVSDYTSTASQITIGVAGIYNFDFEALFNSTACNGGFMAIKNPGETAIYATQDLVSTAQGWNIGASNLYCTAGMQLKFIVQTAASISGCTARIRVTKIA